MPTRYLSGGSAVSGRHLPGVADWSAGVWLFTSLLCSVGVTAEPKRVLIVGSFGHDIAPWNAETPAFKNELAQCSPTPIEFHEVTVQTTGVDGPVAAAALADYLRTLYAPRLPDLAVMMGGPAAEFWWRHREALFPAVPVVIGGIDKRQLERVTLRSNETAVAVELDLNAIMEIVLRVLPGTTNFAAVIGNSAFERFWEAETRQAWQPYTNVLHVAWLSGLSFPEVCRRVAALPPRSAAGYGMFCVDPAGVPYEHLDALDRLCAAASAPVFGLMEDELGHGIIGGHLFSGENIGRETARVAARVLRGERPGDIRTPVRGTGPPMFDWRQLQRWQVPESRLPPGSVVRFRQPSVWEQYRWYILGAAGIILAQAATISGLLLQCVWRRRVERTAREISGRLITTQEDERKRIARDLHDDLNQRLALLSLELDLAGQVPAAGPAGMLPRLEEMADQVKELSSEVHKLSYQLHPAKLDQLGLVTAARTLCHELSAQSGLRIGFTHENIPRALPPEVALCVYRVLQEALGNAIRHSGATEARAALWLRDGRVHLTVSDAGKGFDLAAAQREGGLGLLNMKERARLVRGHLTVTAQPGHGVRVELAVPITPKDPA